MTGRGVQRGRRKGEGEHKARTRKRDEFRVVGSMRVHVRVCLCVCVCARVASNARDEQRDDDAIVQAGKKGRQGSECQG